MYGFDCQTLISIIIYLLFTSAILLRYFIPREYIHLKCIPHSSDYKSIWIQVSSNTHNITKLLLYSYTLIILVFLALLGCYNYFNEVFLKPKFTLTRCSKISVVKKERYDDLRKQILAQKNKFWCKKTNFDTKDNILVPKK